MAKGRLSTLALVMGARTTILAVLLCAGLFPAKMSWAKPPPAPRQLPDGYSLIAFENRSGIRSLDWLSLALPFELGQKAEALAKLRPLASSTERIAALPAEAKLDQALVLASSAFAGEDARWVFTGWIERPDWKLELGVELWRVDGKGAARKASKVGDSVQRGDFGDAHELLRLALDELAVEAKLSSPEDRSKRLTQVPSTDFYAFTLFGRSLSAYARRSNRLSRELAIKTLERTVFIEPTFGYAQRLLGLALVEAGKPNLGRIRLEAALAEDPDDVEALMGLAKLTRARGQTRRAIEIFEDILQRRPWELDIRFELAECYWEVGRGQDAFAELEAVVQHRPGHIAARRIMASIHAERADNEELVGALQELVRLAPKDIDTRLELAAAQLAAGQREDAIATYQGVLEQAPRHVQALKFLGDLYREAGQRDRAIQHYGRALKAAPNDPRAYFLLGAMYVEDGRDQEARRLYLKAQRFGSFRAEAQNNLGAIAFRGNKTRESLWYLRRAVKAKPRNPRYRYNLALSLSATDARDEALAEIQTGLGLDSEHVGMNYLKGVVLLRMGRAEEARQAFERTLELEPGHPQAAHNLSLLDAMKRKVGEGELGGRD